MFAVACLSLTRGIVGLARYNLIENSGVWDQAFSWKGVGLFVCSE